MTIAAADLIAGLAKGMAVLEAFDTARQKLNATLTARRAGITRTAARRHLLTLAHLGYLESADGYYWLAPKVLRFSGSYLATARIPRAVQPALDQLAARTGEGFSVAVLDAGETVIIARSMVEVSADSQSARRVLAHGLHLGARLPAHATSTGRVLLAGMSAAALRDWLKDRHLRRLTPHTLTTAAMLRAGVSEARRQDYCMAFEEHEPGVAALAVPLRDSAGDVVAALNIVTPSARYTPEAMLASFLGPLRDAASQIRSLI